MSNKKGFTLIELLIVVVIIGILAAIAIPKFANTKDKAYVAAMKSDLRNMATSLVLLPLVPIGVMTGLAIAKRISPLLFNRLILWGMGLTGSKLLWDAWH